MNNINGHPLMWELLPNSVYFLYWEWSNKTFSIFINNNIKGRLSEILPANGYTDYYKKKLPNSVYTPQLDDSHGFDCCGKVQNFNETFFKVDFKLEPINSFGESCKECNGSGEKDDRRCFYCNGKGKKIVYSEKIHSITNTISLLLAILDCHVSLDEKDTYEIERADQLYMLRTCIDREMNGHAMGGAQSPRFTRLLAKYFEGKTSKESNTDSRFINCSLASTAMETAYLFLSNESKADSYIHQIQALVRKSGGFYLETQGVNGCTLNTSIDSGPRLFWHKNRSEGKSIDCHNIDSALQQITLLIGLARLSECVVLGI